MKMSKEKLLPEFAMNTLVYNWLILALISLVLEMTSPGLFLFLSFTFGACAGALASWLEYSFNLQLMSALVTTFVAFMLLYFIVRRTKYLESTYSYSSNVYALQGKRGLVVKAIVPGAFGQVKVAGELWAARAQDKQEILMGSWVEIVCVQGAHVIVKKIDSLHGE